MKNAETEDRNADASTKIVVLVLAIIILFGVLVRIGHWHPGYASDDSNYMNNAECLVLGQPPVVENNHTVRLGYETFLAVGMLIFGTTTQTCHALVTLPRF